MSIINSIDKKVRQTTVIHENSFFTKADLYLKWAPFAAVALLQVFKIRTKDDLKQRLFILTLSEGILNSIVYPLKQLTNERRPDLSGKKKSFPSGHTATCFAGAELMREELKDNYPALALAGYGMAFTTGTLRILNKRHWLSDVVAGAVIGIISTRLTFLLYKKIKGYSGKKKKNGLKNVAVGQVKNTTYQEPA
jgi:membrane-associated phospholipid phosphatase